MYHFIQLYIQLHVLTIKMKTKEYNLKRDLITLM